MYIKIFPNFELSYGLNWFQSDDYIRDEIFKQEKGQLIQKYFPRDTTEVAHIPYVNRSALKDSKKMDRLDLKAFQLLAYKLKNSPGKRSL